MAAAERAASPATLGRRSRGSGRRSGARRRDRFAIDPSFGGRLDERGRVARAVPPSAGAPRARAPRSAESRTSLSSGPALGWNSRNGPHSLPTNAPRTPAIARAAGPARGRRRAARRTPRARNGPWATSRPPPEREDLERQRPHPQGHVRRHAREAREGLQLIEADAPGARHHRTAVRHRRHLEPPTRGDPALVDVAREAVVVVRRHRDRDALPQRLVAAGLAQAPGEQRQHDVRGRDRHRRGVRVRVLVAGEERLQELAARRPGRSSGGPGPRSPSSRRGPPAAGPSSARRPRSTPGARRRRPRRPRRPRAAPRARPGPARSARRPPAPPRGSRALATASPERQAAQASYTTSGPAGRALRVFAEHLRHAALVPADEHRPDPRGRIGLPRGQRGGRVVRRGLDPLPQPGALPGRLLRQVVRGADEERQALVAPGRLRGLEAPGPQQVIDVLGADRRVVEVLRRVPASPHARRSPSRASRRRSPAGGPLPRAPRPQDQAVRPGADRHRQGRAERPLRAAADERHLLGQLGEHLVRGRCPWGSSRRRSARASRPSGSAGRGCRAPPA